MMTRYDPFQDLFRLHDQVFAKVTPRAERDPYVPAVDIYEDDKGLVFEAELAGVRLEDVELELEKNVLTLKGERKLARDGAGDGTWRVERREGRFERAFRLPETVSVESAHAEMKHGVLTVRFDKKAEVRPRKIEIKASAEGEETKLEVA